MTIAFNQPKEVKHCLLPKLPVFDSTKLEPECPAVDVCSEGVHERKVNSKAICSSLDSPCWRACSPCLSVCPHRTRLSCMTNLECQGLWDQAGYAFTNSEQHCSCRDPCSCLDLCICREIPCLHDDSPCTVKAASCSFHMAPYPMPVRWEQGKWLQVGLSFFGIRCLHSA